MREQYQIKSTQKLHIKFDHKRHFLLHKDQFLILQFIFIFFFFCNWTLQIQMWHIFPYFCNFRKIFPNISSMISPNIFPSQRKTLFLLSNLAVALRRWWWQWCDVQIWISSIAIYIFQCKLLLISAQHRKKHF